MKRIVFLLIFLPFFGYSQIKVSELTSATTVNNGDYFLLVQSGASKKVAYSVFKYTSTEAAAQISDSLANHYTLTQINDTLAYYTLQTTLSDSLLNYARLDTLASYATNDTLSYYLLSTQVRSDISDSLAAYVPAASGNNTEIQFNNNGVFGTDDDFKYKNDTLYIYKNISSTTDSVKINDAFKIKNNFSFDGHDFTIQSDSGALNIIVGYRAGNGLLNGSSLNTLIGYNSGYNITNGVNNVSIGANAGKDITTGINNTFLGTSTGTNCETINGSVFIGYQSGSDETESNKLYIENSNSSSPLIKGDFSTDELWFNTDTTHIVGHLEVDSNLYVYGRSILEKYEAAAYLDPDSTITTSVTATGWTFLGDGANNKFTNIYSKGFSQDGDTLVFNQAVTDTRDSIEFNFSAHATTAASDVNKTILYSVLIKRSGESAYVEERQITSKTRTITAGVYYSGPTCSTMPIYLRDGDKIQLVAKCATGTTTISTQDGKVYLREQ